MLLTNNQHDLQIILLENKVFLNIIDGYRELLDSNLFIGKKTNGRMSKLNQAIMENLLLLKPHEKLCN